MPTEVTASQWSRCWLLEKEYDSASLIPIAAACSFGLASAAALQPVQL